MDRTKICSLLIGLLALGACSHPKKVIVASKNFTEQVILGEIIAQHIERTLHIAVERRLNLGGTLLAHQALLSREIDLYPEYTGTAFTNVLKQTVIPDPNVVLERVRSQYATEMRLEWLDPLGFNDTFAMVMRGDEARERHLETLTEAAADRAGFVLGAGYEFMQRPDGYGALNSAYPIHWNALQKSMDLGLLYTALKQRQVSMVAGNSTDGMLSVMDLKVLRDDKNAFPPAQACIVVRSDTLASTPGLKAALAQLSGKISNEKMREMNYQVDGKHLRDADVARGFLDANLPHAP